MDKSSSEADYRLDEIDRRIIYALMNDARKTSAPMIAEQVNVSPGTIRNRISQLKDHGIITGYVATIDFERADGRLTNLYLCNVPVAEREALAREARAIPGVVNVRELLTGRRNLHVLAVGENTTDLRRIARGLSKLGIEIEDEDLVRDEAFDAYAPFGPDERAPTRGPTDVISLAGDTEVVEVTVRSDAPIVDRSLAEAVDDGILESDALVIAIERDDQVLTPHGSTVVESDDIVTLLSREGRAGTALRAFLGENHTPSTR